MWIIPILFLLRLRFAFNPYANYHYVNSTNNWFHGLTSIYPIVVGPDVEFIIFNGCHIEHSIYFMGCHTPTSFAQVLSNSTTTTSYMGYNFIVINSEIEDTLQYSGECFAESSRDLLISGNNFVVESVIPGDGVSLKVDMEHDSNSGLKIFGNEFTASSASCQTSECSKISIWVLGVGSSQTSSLVLTSNGFRDTVYASGDERLKDRPTYEVGIKVETDNLGDLETLLSSSNPILYETSSVEFQRIARNLGGRMNQNIVGSLYIVVVTDGSTLTCWDTCYYGCDEVCIVDPTRISSLSSGVCYNVTLFDLLSAAISTCSEYYNVVLAFPTLYDREILTVGRNMIVGTITRKTTTGGLGNHTMYDKPTIVHTNNLIPNNLETDGHSIYINTLGFVTFQDLAFVFQDDYQSPWFGTILFSKQYDNHTSFMTLSGCSFLGNNLNSVLFNSLKMNDLIGELRIEDCWFNGVINDIVPDSIESLVFNRNRMTNMNNGIISVIVSNHVEVVGNIALPAEGVFVNMACGGTVCITGDGGACSSTACRVRDNIIHAESPPSAETATFRLEGLNMGLTNITNNTSGGDNHGLEYLDMTYIPCEYQYMRELKYINLGIHGWVKDIICDRNEVSEKSCSLPCYPPRPPPDNCTVTKNVTITDIDYLYSLFPSVEAALQYCLSTPIQHILVMEDTYFESNLIFSPADMAVGQTGLILEGHGNPIIVGVNHFFVMGYRSSILRRIIFSSQDFNGGPTTPSTAAKLIGGNVMNLEFDNVVLRSVPIPTGTPNVLNNIPDVDRLVDVTIVDANITTSFTMKNVTLLGSKVESVAVEDMKVGKVDETSVITLMDIVGVANWGRMVLLEGSGQIEIDGLTCVTWCARILETESIIRITNKEVYSTTSKLDLKIENLVVDATTDSIVQTVETFGSGYVTALWIEGPNLSPLEVSTWADNLILTNVVLTGVPIGLRYIGISDSVLKLVETAVVPISYDEKRGMRESARFNTIEGTRHDVRSSTPNVDGIDDLNTCDDLCLSPDGEICEVNSDFNPTMTDGFGLRRFHTIRDAIDDCVSTSSPLPVKLVLLEGESDLLITKVHTEDVNFDYVGNLMVYGTLSKTGGSRITLAGAHTVEVGQTGDFILRDLELLADNSAVPVRTTPIIESITPGIVMYNMVFRNLVVSTNLDPLYNSALVFHNVDSDFVRLEDVTIESGPDVENLGVVHLPLLNVDLFAISGLTIERSEGPAVVANMTRTGGMVSISSSTFTKCGMGLIVPHNGCIIVGNPLGTVATSGKNEVTRVGATFMKQGETYFSGFVYVTNITVSDVHQSSTVHNIRGWETSSEVPVGIRVVGVNFTDEYLALNQKHQKIFIRKISTNNVGIEATILHDVVLNTQDDLIEANPGNNERLFCTDSCQFRTTDYGQLLVIMAVIGVLGFTFILILCLTCPLRLLMTGRTTGGLNLPTQNETSVVRKEITRRRMRILMNNKEK